MKATDDLYRRIDELSAQIKAEATKGPYAKKSESYKALCRERSRLRKETLARFNAA